MRAVISGSALSIIHNMCVIGKLWKSFVSRPFLESYFYMGDRIIIITLSVCVFVWPQCMMGCPAIVQREFAMQPRQMVTKCSTITVRRGLKNDSWGKKHEYYCRTANENGGMLWRTRERNKAGVCVRERGMGHQAEEMTAIPTSSSWLLRAWRQVMMMGILVRMSAVVVECFGPTSYNKIRNSNNNNNIERGWNFNPQI